MRRDRRSALPGTTLLEVVAALAILALAGTSFLALAAQQRQATRALHDGDAQVREAANILARTVVWPPGELRARVGITMLDGHRVAVAVIAPSLYSIAVLDRARPSAILGTSRYAPRGISDAR